MPLYTYMGISIYERARKERKEEPENVLIVQSSENNKQLWRGSDAYRYFVQDIRTAPCRRSNEIIGLLDKYIFLLSRSTNFVRREMDIY